MRITTDRSGDVSHTTIEWTPMSTERFEAIVKLAETAIGGAVLLGAVHMVGTVAIGCAVGAFVAIGLYKIAMEGLR